MTSPSMVHRSGDTLVVRSVVSGDALYQDEEQEDNANFVSVVVEESENATGNVVNEGEEDELDLPQCKIKRNYTCTDCSFYSQNPRSYLYHLKDVHKQKIRVYECPSCLYASKHSQKLQRHVHMVHVMNKRGNKQQAVKKKKPKKPPPILISVDPSTLPGGSKAVDVVLNGERLKCSICGFATHNANIMSRHEKLVHLKKRFFRCNKCNYVTHMRARYTKHVKYHSMPMIKCDLCDFRTPYKWNLDRHYKNHTGDGAFKCALCNFTADIKQSLTVHEMNHHVPPVGQAGGGGVAVGRRRNKVGASDTLAQEEEIGQEEMELLRMEREDGAADYFQVSDFDSTMNTSTPKYSLSNNRIVNGPNNTVNTFARKVPKIKMTLKKLKPQSQSVQEQNERHNFQTDFIHPDDIIHHKNGNVYIKTIKCRICNFKAAWEGEMARHENKVHGMQRPLVAKKTPRPIPNLIPIQNKTTSPPPPMTSLPILRIPSVRSRTAAPLRLPQPSSQDHVEAGLSERDLNEICAKSCPNSSLRDFASLMGGADVFSNVENNTNTDVLQSRVKPEPKSDGEETKSPRASPTLTNPRTSPFSTTSFKKKNASFFDKLKEKLLVGTGETCNLGCWCGHESKCLSELMRHQKLHSEGAGSVGGASASSGGSSLSSTRCQHCRQRCKTSSDLVIHLQSCQEANKSVNSSNSSHEESVEDNAEEKVSEENGLQQEADGDAEVEGEAEAEAEAEEEDKMEDLQGPHPMENKVFVWNSLPEPQEADCEEECLQQMPPVAADDDRSKSPTSEESLVGVETAPGYGAVMGSGQDPPADSDEKQPVKKVFKCPHCTFWASTASRFHVHIVGHLNKKPFECSLCAYRSNWRWDITKHIRLKSARDRNHESAGVLMTDETGRRNYSKYNKYLTLMRVHEPSAESSGSGRRTKGAIELTQGMSPRISSGSQLQPILPSPPKLTRAPDLIARSPRLPGPGTLRPPPPLRAAHLVFTVSSRPQQQQHSAPRLLETKIKGSNVETPAKRPSLDGKKTLWKCKKCNFRDASRELVLAHVKEHYQQRDAAQAVPGAIAHSASGIVANPAHGEASVGRGHAPFRCGHCHQVSNWKHVIQRHCRLKHSGDVRVVRGGRSKSLTEKEIEEDDSQDENGEIKKCETCSFSTSSPSEMDAHSEQHESVLQEKQPESAASNDETECETDKVDQNSQLSEGSPTKRYKCVGCPYVSNSKSQFLYHKQFHRPRGAPFKCGLCSYNVSRRHLLHQHLRVHGILIPPQKSPTKQIEDGGDEGSDEIEEVSAARPELDTRRLVEIPLVWVSREGKFSKMFKCRFCPHVNMRKANIHEHEKMHAARVADASHSDTKTEPSSSAPQLQQHHCPDCNYICNNAGVLSSHAKVHQGMYGQVHCLVDASRSDEVQIRELTAIEREENVATQEAEFQHTSTDMGHVSDVHNQPGMGRCLSVEGGNHFLTNTDNMEEDQKDTRLLYFCPHCPARFLFEKELGIHLRFHEIRLPHQCESCSYTARQRPHLLAHLKVHSDEYQERTNAMLRMFETSPQHPRPRSAVIVEGPGMQGPAWIVIGGDSREQTSPQANYADDRSTTVKQPNKQYSCHLCPATFFKSVALQYHLSLHGGVGPHKCRYCDYAVKTYGNLVKHEMIHKNPSLKSDASHIMGKGKVLMPVQSIPLSGTDLFEHRAEAQKRESSVAGNNYQLSSYIHPPAPMHVDPQFGILMHGSPDFVYPTYLKNGRLKEKRYKCHKCPSAFEKREQYKVHLSLHGAKQRYKCEKCDYSVKYYANYIQHMRKHQNNDQAMLARKQELGDNDQQMAEDLPMEISSEDNIPTTPNPRCAKTIRGGILLNQNGPLLLSVADRQSLMLLQQKRTPATSNNLEVCEEVKKSFWCPHCPYSSMRRDGVESHVKRHEAVSGVRGLFVCAHCDYSVPQQHFLREHNKLHFTPSKKQPEVYMKCSRTELWALDDGKENVTDRLKMDVANAEKTIIFQDFGSTKPNVERFFPTLPPDVDFLDCQNEDKIYMNIHTGEPVGEEVPAEVGALEKENVDSNILAQDAGVSIKDKNVDIKVVSDESEQSSLSQSVSSTEDNKASVSSESDEEESRTNEIIDSSLSPVSTEVPCGDLVE